MPRRTLSRHVTPSDHRGRGRNLRRSRCPPLATTPAHPYPQAFSATGWWVPAGPFRTKPLTHLRLGWSRASRSSSNARDVIATGGRKAPPGAAGQSWATSSGDQHCATPLPRLRGRGINALPPIDDIPAQGAHRPIVQLRQAAGSTLQSLALPRQAAVQTVRQTPSSIYPRPPPCRPSMRAILATL